MDRMKNLFWPVFYFDFTPVDPADPVILSGCHYYNFEAAARGGSKIALKIRPEITITLLPTSVYQ